MTLLLIGLSKDNHKRKRIRWRTIILRLKSRLASEILSVFCLRKSQKKLIKPDTRFPNICDPDLDPLSDFKTWYPIWIIRFAKNG